MSTQCSVLNWSPSTADSLEPILIVCIIGIIIHGIFWIEFLACSPLRQRNMMWIYVYLITDFLLISRFFILYSIRLAAMCLFTTSRDIICYFEAASKIYINTIQSYLLLAFNICRHIQIVYNRNVYVEKIYLIIFIHFLMYILPALNFIIQFLTALAQISRKRGGSCDIQYSSLIVQIFNLFVIYIIPIIINIIIISLGIRYVSSIKGVLSEQIIRRRRKRQRILLIQTITFYSIWLILWSPDILAFQFTNVNSDPAIFTSLLSYIEIAIDPAIIAIIDIRLLTIWQMLWNKIKRRRQIGVVS